MLSLKEESVRISRSLQDTYAESKKLLTKLEDEIIITSKEFKAASEEGDHRENAAYTTAQEDLANLNKRKINLLRLLDDIEQLKSDSTYVPKSFIGLYSTFRLLREDTEEISTWKVFPGLISDTDRGIMSDEAPIFKLLKDKQAGDIIEQTHKISGKTINFRILEVY
jgi:transcription elongation GreA/GreB family factor